MNWLCFITSLPTENATLRQRAWRALKSSGASVLRDGVYLLPDLLGNRALLDGIPEGHPNSPSDGHLKLPHLS